MPGVIDQLFGSVYETTIATVNIALLLLIIYLFGDAIKTTIDYFIPNKDKKIGVKYGIAILLIVILFVFNLIFMQK